MNPASSISTLRVNSSYLFLLSFIVCMNFSSCKTTETPTLAIINAKIWTGDEAKPLCTSPTSDQLKV